MSELIAGRDDAEIRAVIITALDGQTLAGMTYNTTLKLTQSCNPLSLTSPGATAECVDGGFIVLVGSSRTTSGVRRQTSGGYVQRQWPDPFIIRFSVDVSAYDEYKLSVDLYKIRNAVLRLVNAALEPQSGTNYTIESVSKAPPVQTGNILIYEVTYVVSYWFS